MKKCDKCDRIQSNSRIFCVDCGEHLKIRLSDEEVDIFNKETERIIEKESWKNDPLHISVLDKIIGYLSLAGIAATILFSFVYFHDHDCDYRALVILTFIAAIIFFVCCFLGALYPKMGWELEKIRLSFTIHNVSDITPSDYYLVSRKIGTYVCFFISVIVLVMIISSSIAGICLYSLIAPHI